MDQHGIQIVGVCSGYTYFRGAASFTATYTISAAAEKTSRINNTATGIASTPGNSGDVTDVSDNGNDGDGNTTNDPTVVEITPNPSMEVTKEGTVTDNGNGTLGVGIPLIIPLQ